MVSSCFRNEQHWPYAWVVGLKKSDLDAFIFEISLALGKIERSVVWRSVPNNCQHAPHLTQMQSTPVGQEGNLISRHLDFGTNAELVSTPT